MARFARMTSIVLTVCLVMTAGALAQPEWVNVGLEGETVNGLCLDPFEQTTIFAACESGLYRYNDFVMSWDPLSATPVNVVAASPAEQGLVYAAGENWVARSEDGGNSWTVVWQQAELGVRKLLAHPTDPALVFARRANGVWRSTDRGNGWEQVWTDLTEVETDVMVIAGQESEYVCTITADSLYIGSNEGSIWTAISPPVQWDFELPINGLAVLAEYPAEIAVTGQGWPYSYNLAEKEWWGFSWVEPYPQPPNQRLAMYHDPFLVTIADDGFVVASHVVWDPPGAYTLVIVDFPDPTTITCTETGGWDIHGMYLGTVDDGVWHHQSPVYLPVIEKPAAETLSSFTLSEAYPNPFNASTRITLALEHPETVTVSVYDVLGQHVTTLHQGALASGRHSFTWDADGVASGVYFVHAEAGADQAAVQKVILLR